MKLSEIRKSLPQYDHISDYDLADAIHKKDYPDMDRNEFYSKVGVKTSSFDNLMKAEKVDAALINATPKQVRDTIDTKQKAIEDKHNKLNQLLGDKPLENPVVSPEFFLGAPVRMGQGLLAKALGEKVVGDAMLKGGAAYGVGSVTGDLGAQAGIEGVDATLTDNFKEQHPDITNALRMTTALGLGGTLGYKAEMKALNPTQKAKIIKGVDEGKISPEKAQELFENDAKVSNAMSDNMEADFKAKEAPQAVNNVTNDVPTQPITTREQFIKSVTEARGEEEALMNINLIDAKAKAEGITTDDWLTKNGLKVEQHATDGAEFAGKGDSLNQSLESDKFFATHRTNINNLNKMADSGVLPAPSFALAKNAKATEQFGDIIIVPKEKHIDPNKGAHVFGGDAWTPRIKFDEEDIFEVIDYKAPVFDRLPKLKAVAKEQNDSSNFYSFVSNDQKLYGQFDDWAKATGREADDLIMMATKQIFKEEAPSIDIKIKAIKKLIKDNDGDMRGLEDAWTPEYIYKYAKYHTMGEIKQRIGELKTFKNKDRFYEEAQKAMKNDTQPPADYMEAKRLDKVQLDDVSRIVVPHNQYDEVVAMMKDKGIDVPIVKMRKGETENSAIRRSSDGASDVMFQKLPSETVNALVQFGAKSKGEVNTIIRLFKTADVSSIPHELAHVFRRNLSPQELRSAEKAFKVIDGHWTVANEEAFAEGFVKWLSEGRAPTKELASTFKQFQSWLKDLWLTLIKSKEQGFVLTKEHKEFYKAMMGDKEAAKKLFHPKVANARGTRLAEWHKDSHPLTKNEDGTPKVFYHGTTADFDSFRPSESRLSDDATSMFTDNPNIADNYNYDPERTGSNTIPVHLNIKNPKVINGNSKNISAQISSAKAKGHDGVIIQNHNGVDNNLRRLNNPNSPDGEILNSNTYISFEPTQIKSIHNRGTFDETNPNILYQKIVDDSGQPKEVAKVLSDVIKKNVIERGTDAVIKAPFRMVAYAIKKADSLVSTSKMGGLYKDLKAVGNSDTVDWFTGHRIYQKHDYMDMRDHALQSVNRASEKVLRMHSQLAELSDQAREAIYDYMTGYKDQVQLSPELKRLADNMTRTIDDAGQKMVDEGFLSEQAYEDWKGQYLHRRYTSKMKTATDFTKGKGQFNVDTIQERGKRWKGTEDEFYELEQAGLIGKISENKIEADVLPSGEYSFRRDWTREERTAMGEIRDIAYSFPETYARMAQMIEYGKMLKSIPDQYIMLQGSRIDKTMMGLGYTKLEGDRYGALNGQWVDNTIAADIRHTNEDIMGADLNGRMASMREAYKSYVSLWKQSHTVFNTTAHVNNLTSNVVMQFSAGLNPRKAMTYAYDGGVALKKFGVWSKLNARKLTGLTDEEATLLNSIENNTDFKMLLEVQEQGLFGRSQLNDMLNSYMSPSVNMAESVVGKSAKFMQELYEAEDNIMRFAAFKQLREAGMEAADAVKVINRDIIPDYSKPMSEAARKLRGSGLVPFMSWMYYSTPIIVKQMVNNPSRTAALIAGIYAIDKSFGVDPYNEEDMPQDGFATQRMVIGRDGSEVTGLRIQSMIPQSQFADPYETYVRSLATGGIPQTIMAAIGDVNLYYKQPVTTKTGIVGAYHRTKNVVQNIMPTPDVLDKMWNIAETQVMDEKTRKSSAVYMPRSAGQEAASFFLNTLTYDMDKQAQKVQRERDKEDDN